MADDYMTTVNIPKSVHRQLVAFLKTIPKHRRPGVGDSVAVAVENWIEVSKKTGVPSK